MALTATFAADFDAFVSAIESAKVNLRVFDRETKNAARSVSRELESISGQRVAAEAARMAEAVKRLGGEGGVAAGLLKLTDDELKRLQATMDSATTKAARLGEQLPASLKHITDEMAKLPKPADDANKKLGVLDASFVRLTTSFAAASVVDRVVSGVANFAAGAVNAAGELVDLSKATQVSIGRLQEWQHVAGQGGIQLENMTKASFDLGAKLQGGSGSVVQAVDRLGLSFASLKALKPEDQLDEVLKAAEALGPSQERNAILVDLFGSRGAQALARIVDGYRDTAAEAAKAGDAQVESLDRAADAWDRLQGRIGAAAITVGGGFAQWIEDSIAALSLLTSGTAQFTETQRAMIAELVNSGGEGLAAYLRSIEGARKTDIDLSKSSTAALADYAREVAAAKAEIALLLPEQLRQLDAALQLDRGFEELATSFGLSTDAQRLYSAVTKETAEGTKQAAAAAEAYGASLRALSGESALAGADKAMQQLQDLGGLLHVLPSQLEGLRKQFIAGAEAAALIGDTELAEFYRGVAKDLTPASQLQSRYNVVLGEYVEAGLDAAEVSARIADQVNELTGNVTRILPPLTSATNAWIGYAQAVDDARPEDWNDRLGDLVDFTTGLAKELDKSADAFARLAQVSGRGMGQVAEAITIAATAMKDFNDVLKNVAEGDNVGAIVAGIRLGTNLAASLWDGLTSSAGERAAREAGRDFGVWISEELGNMIAADADKLFGGDRFTSSIFNLSDIIGADGGLTADNLERMTARLRDVFVLLQDGSLTSAQAVHVLDENWNDFVEAGTDAAGRLKPSLTEIIRLTRELGVASKEIEGYLSGQAGSAIQGINAVINASKAQFDAWSDIADAVQSAQERIDELNQVEDRGRGVEWTREMEKAQQDVTKALTDQHGAGEAAAAELENLGRIAMGTYAAAIKAGMSHNEALRAAAPGLSQIIKAYEDLGLSVEDAGLKAFLAQAKFVEANPEILAGIDGLAQSMIALSNIGLLDVETFNEMQEAGQRMYEKLLEQAGQFGLEGDEAARAALVPMQEYLRQAAEQAELLGVPLDEVTQKLIDQSKELGLWKDKGEDPLLEMKDAVLEMRDAVKELTAALKGLPSDVTTTVRTRFTREGEPDGGGAAPTPSPSSSAAAAADRWTGGPSSFTAKVYLDGRQVATAIAPHRREAERFWGAN